MLGTLETVSQVDWGVNHVRKGPLRMVASVRHAQQTAGLPRDPPVPVLVSATLVLSWRMANALNASLEPINTATIASIALFAIGMPTHREAVPRRVHMTLSRARAMLAIMATVFQVVSDAIFASKGLTKAATAVSNARFAQPTLPP